MCACTYKSCVCVVFCVCRSVCMNVPTDCVYLCAQDCVLACAFSLFVCVYVRKICVHACAFSSCVYVRALHCVSAPTVHVCMLENRCNIK